MIGHTGLAVITLAGVATTSLMTVCVSSSRFSCISANSCKECMMDVDGKTVYACTTRLAERDMTVEPLPNKTWVRDVVTEIAPPDERLGNELGK